MAQNKETVEKQLHESYAEHCRVLLLGHVIVKRLNTEIGAQ